MTSRKREQCSAVIECCRPPRSLRVTLRAICAKIPSNVIRIRCPVKYYSMTVDAGAGQIRELVIHMTLSACNRLMRADKRKER